MTIEPRERKWRKSILENDVLKITLIPNLGGKVIEIINKKTGTQFLKGPSTELSDITPPQIGFPFKPPYAFGFDECFPTVAPSVMPFNERVIQLPDHGELWTQPCKVERKNDKILLISEGVNVNYEFHKEIHLKQNEINISYQLKNTTYKEFDYLWSAHPLLKVDVGDEILLPEEIKDVRVYYSAEDATNAKQTKKWPFLNDETTDFSFVQKKGSTAMKLFAENVNTGRAGLYRKQKRESILFDYDTDKIPHLGLWLCYGGWPVDSEKGDFTVAIEPATAAVDKLSEASSKAQQRVILPGETHEWSLKISIIEGRASV